MDRKAFAKDLANYELMLAQYNEDKRKWGGTARSSCRGAEEDGGRHSR